ncbi:MAG: winged helix DNA-binding domain-containing protein [Mycobacteriales bacterium]
MAPADAAQQRMVNQLLAGPSRAGPADVVRHLGAMQAQDYAQALWAIGARLARLTVTDVTDAIADRVILRTWPLRGTIHFLPSADAAWMLEVSAARTIARRATRLAELGLDETTLQRCHRLLRAALADGPVTRPRIMELLEAAGIGTAGQRGYTVLWHAAQSGLICFGPIAGKQQTFALLEDWVPSAMRTPVDQPAVELARRYFTSHGPATVHDFAWWAAITVTAARSALAALPEEFSSTSIDGTAHWSAVGPPPRAAPGPRLLAGFDEILLGYQDRSAALPTAYAPRIVPGGNGVFQPTMIRDGQVVGTWRRAVTAATSVTVDLFPFEDVAPSVDAFCAEAERFADFLEVSLARVTVHDPGVGN